MYLEIERRFLVNRGVDHLCVAGERIVQGYLPFHGEQTVRVRIAGPKATLTMKSKRNGCSRIEVEWDISTPVADEVIRHSCDGVVEKTRYRVDHGGLCWEIDVFEGRNAGLVIAEVELTHPEQPVALPDWVGVEVTNDNRYSNSRLAREPFANWRAASAVALGHRAGDTDVVGEQAACQARALGAAVMPGSIIRIARPAGLPEQHGIATGCAHRHGRDTILGDMHGAPILSKIYA